MGIGRQRNSGYIAEQVKYCGTRPFQFPAPFHALAWVDSDQAANKRDGRVHYEKIIIIIIIQHLYSAIMSYADTEALVAPVKSE